MDIRGVDLNLLKAFDALISERAVTRAAALAEQAPRATLRLLPLNGADAAEQLERGAIDVAIAHLRAPPTAIESRMLMRDPFVVIVRKGHPLAADTLSIEAYAAQSHIL